MLTDRFLYLRFLVRGANTEKVLNSLRKENIPLKKIRRRQDRTLICQCKKCDGSIFIRQCERFSCTAAPLPPPLFSRFLMSLFRNKAFCTGALVFLIAVYASMQHIWAVQIVDAGAYSGDIRAYLEENGIVPGVRKSAFSPQKLQRELEWRYPQAAWVKAEYRGVYLRITLVEGIATPLIETQGIFGDVVAASDGIVSSVVTLAGTPQVKSGDFVHKGQVLIAGREQGVDGSTHPVKARGQVSARIWIEEKVSIPAAETLTVPTGERLCRTVFHSPFFSFSLTPSPSYASYDLEKKSYTLGGAWLPVYLTRETYEAFTLSTVPRDEASLRTEAAKAAENLLDTRLQTGDVVVDKWVDYSMIEVESYAAVAVAEVLRDIGRFRALEP